MKKLKIILQFNLTYIFLLMFILLFIFVKTIAIKYRSNLNDEETLVGIVTKINISDNKLSFILKSQEKVICNYYNENLDYITYSSLLGKKIKVNGTLNDASNNTIPNNFNYKKYLYNNKIYKTFKVSNIEIIENENIFYRVKNNIIKRINNYDNQIKSYLNLFILGDKSYLDNNIYSSYRINGIWHLFAISGMHINLIILVLNKILQKIRLKNIIICLFLFFFAFITELSASVLRVTVFYSLSSLFKKLDIKVNNKKLLFLTAFVILIFNPFMIYNVGFQYSFLITLAIMLFSNKITGNYFIKLLKISFISFLASLPITININYEVNLLSIFLNIIYVPFISIIIFPCSILTFIFPILSNIFKILIDILEFTTNFFNIWKISIIIPKLPLVLIFSYYFSFYLFYKSNMKKYMIFLTAIILLNILLTKLDNSLYIYYLDVDQGDSSIIISPYKKEVIMIDTGGILNSNYYISNNTIQFLKSLGINKIDVLALSHGDYDHMGDAINLVENFKVEKVIFNCGDFNRLEQELIKVLEKNKMPYYSCIKELNVDDNKLYFLNNKDYSNENDNSSVIYTEFDNYKFLFMGDTGVEAEQDLIEKYNLQNIDVLKVGHHGSKTSSSKNFIDEISPKYSIISVGKNNRYGHPNNNVLDNLKQSIIYRTDENGSILLKIENSKLEIETCIP